MMAHLHGRAQEVSVPYHADLATACPHVMITGFPWSEWSKREQNTKQDKKFHSEPYSLNALLLTQELNTFES